MDFASEYPLKCRRRLGPVIALCLIILSVSGPSAAQELPLQRFTAADGLSQDSVNRIVRDSRGFLWFCTGDGLSRFDGSRFKNYTQEQGLPHRNVNDVLETRDGEYLVATSAGVSVFDRYGAAIRWDVIAGDLEDRSVGSPLFRSFTPRPDAAFRTSNAVNALEQHGDGSIYAATNNGLFRFVGDGADRRFEEVLLPGQSDRVVIVNDLGVDLQGAVWVATVLGVFRIGSGGGVETIDAAVGSNSVFVRRDGSVWVDSGGHDLGIRVYRTESDRTPTLLHTFTTRDGLAANVFSNAVAETLVGKLYIRTTGTLFEYLPTATPGDPRFVRLGKETIQNSAIDSAGNLWFGTFGNGAFKLPVSNITTYPREDKTSQLVVGSLYIDRADDVYLITTEPKLDMLEGGKLSSVTPDGLAPRSWGTTFLDLQSNAGEWWIPTTKGLYRYPHVDSARQLEQTKPVKIYGNADGLGEFGVFNIFEDSRGDIWITSVTARGIQRWDHATETIIPVGAMPGIGANNGGATTFGEDRSGNVWVGFYFGGLGRFRRGEFRTFGAAEGIPETGITDFHTDREGRLWLATTNRGLFRVDDANADLPTFRNISTREGLQSNGTLCLAEDNFGMIYAGTGRGLHRIDPRTGTVKVYTERDSLPGNYVYRCREDSKGNIWFVASGVLTKLSPSAESASVPPATYIDGLSVNGNNRRISELGETELKDLDLDAGENRIEISYFALGTGTGETPRYQYRIGGTNWSDPTPATSVTFDLAPGQYDVAIRAISADGTVSETPASVSFSIAQPIWQRWWFVTLSFLLIGGAIFALDRYRVSKTRQIQRALSRSRESETRFRTLADTASDAIITIDEDSTIVFVNQAVERVFGYEPDEIIGKKLTLLMPERMRPGHEAGLARYLRSSAKSIEWSGVPLPGLRKDGIEIPLELSFGEVERDGRKYFTGIARDITERLRAEEEIRLARDERMRELQKVRSRIATDLHDDIGSSLTQIAVLSEVARGQAAGLKADAISTPLDRIKNVSKELVSVMSDIVWAINPQKDYLNDLVQRMRRFGSDILSGRGVEFEFNAPEANESIELGANIRREIFAIYKESINNAVKYAECTKVTTDFFISTDSLILSVSDDGKGFDTEFVLSGEFKPEMGGNGLASIKRRAIELGGICEIRSSVGKGTEIRLTVPLGPREKSRN